MVDAGPLYAYVDADDAHHASSLELLEAHPGPLIVPTLVVTEVVNLLGTRLGVGPEVQFLGDLASGVFSVEPVAAIDWLRIAELVARYRDLPLAAQPRGRLHSAPLVALRRNSFTFGGVQVRVTPGRRG